MNATREITAKKTRKNRFPEAFDLELLEGERQVLRAYVQSLSAIKTLNEAIHNGTYMAKLKPTPVYLEYDGQEKKTITENGKKKRVTKKLKKTKTLYLETYLVKGLKGLLRHLLMALLDALGVSGCHSTNRLTYGKEEQSAIPDSSFVHPLGACVKEDSKTRQEGCLTYQIFGAMLEQSIIRVDQVLIAQANGNTIPKTVKVVEPSRKVVFAHIATEVRNVMTIEQKPIQDFREHYFDTDFVISVDVTQCTLEQLGALVEAFFHAKELGGGKTAGYGKIAIDRVDLQGITEQRQIVLTEKGFEPKTTIQERSLPAMLQEAFLAWEAYKETHRTIHKAAKPTGEGIA
ncbi:MAG: hypothetical protein ACXAB4_06365 [Candidatus Hodarchaeales archaeon]|jgi:hypothetical protein